MADDLKTRLAQERARFAIHASRAKQNGAEWIIALLQYVDTLEAKFGKHLAAAELADMRASAADLGEDVERMISAMEDQMRTHGARLDAAIDRMQRSRQELTAASAAVTLSLMLVVGVVIGLCIGLIL